MKVYNILANVMLGVLFSVLVWDVEIWRALLLMFVVCAAQCLGYTSGVFKRFDN